MTDWIGARLPGSGLFSAERIGRELGIANALFTLSRGRETVVLRRPPLVKNAASASDTAREWRVLTALTGTAVPHPAPLLYCDDQAVIGAPFMIMSFVDGLTPVGALPAPYDLPRARRDLGFAMVDAIAELSSVDWQSRGLTGFGKPSGFLDRQVSRWLGQLSTYHTREIPELDSIASWLEANKPDSDQPPGLLHGDYSPFNVMASRSDTTVLAAVVDWDTCTVGDPLLDIGHLLARWTDPGEAFALRVDIETRDGLPRRHELATRYAERTGRDLSALRYYESLALFKLALILEGGVARASGAGDRANADQIAHTVDRLIHYAGVFARGERA